MNWRSPSEEDLDELATFFLCLMAALFFGTIILEIVLRAAGRI